MRWRRPGPAADNKPPHIPDAPSVAVADTGDVSATAGGSALSGYLGPAAGAAASVVSQTGKAVATGERSVAVTGAVTIGKLTVYEAAATQDSPSLDRQADLLSAAMRAQGQRAAIERRLIGPALLPVRWRRSKLPVAGPVSAATATHGGGIQFTPLPGLAPVTPADLRRGDRTALHAVYGGLASGRLVILGPGGAGKSSAAVLLLLDALHHREQLTAEDRRHVPVPVVVTPHGWNPKTISVRDWLAGKLTESPPFHGRRGLRHARSLLDAGRVAVFLDGLDEVNESLRAMMLQALSEQVTFRLVLLTRSVELVAAAESALLVGAAAVQLRPLTSPDVVSYLKRHLVDPPPAPWRAVADEITHRRTGPLGRALTNPLNVSLLRDVYPPGGPVDELLDKGRFSTAEDIEIHLLDHVLGAAYAPRLGFPPPRYSERTAQRTLGYLAHQLTLDQSRELGWWDFYRWVSRKSSTLLLNSAIAAVLLGLTAAAVAVPMVGREAGLMFAGWLALSFVVPGGSLHRVPVRFGSAWRRDRFTGRPLTPRLPEMVKEGVILATLLGLLCGGLVWWSKGKGTGLAAGGLTGGVVLLLWSFGTLLTLPNTGDTSWSDPPTTRWQDVQAALITGPLMGLATGALASSVLGLRDGAMMALLGVLFGSLMATEMWAALLSQLNLAIRLRTPVRMIRFLEDARNRHLLRAVGPAYQFRHLKFQDHLVGQYLIQHHVATAIGHPQQAARHRLLAVRGPSREPDVVARHLLCIGAMLDPAGVPAEVLGTAWRLMSSAAPPSPAVAAGTPVTTKGTQTAIRTLMRTGLISLSEDAPGLGGVNEGVQRAIRSSLSDTERTTLARSAADALLASWPEREDDPDQPEVWRANTIALSRRAGDALWRPELHGVLLRVGESLNDSGETAAAVDHYRALLDTAHRILGSDDPQTLRIREHLEEQRGRAGDADAAAAGFAELLADSLRISGPDHPVTLATRHHLARWQGNAGNPAEAAATYAELLPDSLRILGPDHPDTLTTRHNLAGWRGEAGDTTGAATAFEELLADWIRVLGPDHPTTLMAGNTLAHWRCEAGDTAGAATATAELLPDLLRVLGPDHPETLIARARLAEWQGAAEDAAGAATAYTEGRSSSEGKP